MASTDGTEQRPFLRPAPSSANVLDVPEFTMHVSQRFRSPGLLAFGAGSSLLAFTFVSCIGYIDYKCLLKNKAYNITYESGNGYWPSTVSEMAHNTESPAGKVFHTFGLIAGVSIFLSMYPTHLRNVYTFDEKVPCTALYWTTFRQIVPAMGIWLLVGVNTYPTPEAMASKGYTKMFCVLLHLAGAGMLFVGYMFAELHTLGIWPFRRQHPDAKWPAIEKTEMRCRTTIAILITLGFVLFCIMQVALVVAKKFDVCCPDEWILPGEVMNLTDHGGGLVTVRDTPQLQNTASGTYLWLKILSYFCEDIAGLSLVISHLAIWYFCEERHVDYGTSELHCVHYQGAPAHQAALDAGTGTQSAATT